VAAKQVSTLDDRCAKGLEDHVVDPPRMHALADLWQYPSPGLRIGALGLPP